MKLKKVASILLAVSMIAGMTVTNVMAADTEEAGEETTEETGEETTLTMWSWSPITRTCEKMIEAFEKENPGVRVEINWQGSFLL